MTTMRFTLDGTDQKVIAALRLRSSKLIDALTNKMSFLMLKLQQKVQLKLSGQVLQNREGVLFSSVQVQPTTFDGVQITGAVTAAGGPASFGKAFEFGGQRTYKISPINKKALALMAGPGILDVLRGQVASKSVVVAYVWHPPTAKRPFMAPSLAESIDSMRSGFEETIISVLREPL